MKPGSSLICCLKPANSPSPKAHKASPESSNPFP